METYLIKAKSEELHSKGESMSDKDIIKLPIEQARIICQMDSLCEGEGFRVDSDILMYWIFVTFPELLQEFSHMWSVQHFCIEDKNYKESRKKFEDIIKAKRKYLGKQNPEVYGEVV